MPRNPAARSLIRRSVPEGGAYFQQGRLVPIVTLQESAGAPERLLAGIANHALEAAIDVNERLIGQLRIADGNAVAGSD